MKKGNWKSEDKLYGNIYEANKSYLEENGICFFGNSGLGFELESHTPAGGDMVICLDTLTKEKLLNYIDEFDINQEVILWWPDGERGRGVPFANIRDHYNDIEAWLENLREVVEGMPY